MAPIVINCGGSQQRLHCRCSHQLPVQTTMTTIATINEEGRPMDTGGHPHQLCKKMMVIADGGNSGSRHRQWQGARVTWVRADEGVRARMDKGARARARVDRSDNNDKQQERASKDGAVA